MIRIISIGKLGSNKALQEIFQSYLKMIGWKIEIIELETKKKLVTEELKNAEAELIIEKIRIGQVNIILEENGKEYTSPEFAKFLKKLEQSVKDINFIIGGAYGIGEKLREKADYTLSLSQMTFPHLFARVMLIEQIYRAQTILANHPYHK
ncbi:MAG: rlmH [Rickettsiaceae bacterium]|jgi:23S rRNA (pseudouridine1915-N3)-methyltransferase|nr:rlmH [Rickettsiaceae bacterium]